MKKITYFTSNKGKVESLKVTAAKHNIEVVQRSPKEFDDAKDYDLLEPRSYDLKEIAKIKAIYAFKKIGMPLVVTDEGFYLDRWPKFPGSFTNFALESLKTEGILKLIEKEQRSCSFKTCMAYIDDKLEPVFFESETRGTLTDKPKGNKKPGIKSDLGYLFIPEGCENTAAEMTEEDYLEFKKRNDPKSYSTKFLQWYAQQ